MSTAQREAFPLAWPPSQARTKYPRTSLGGTWPDGLDNAANLAIAKHRHRELSKLVHPDLHNGSTDRQTEANSAMTEAETELQP